jgi:eukaryotic-like serine/threonine-protein kinase
MAAIVGEALRGRYTVDRELGRGGSARVFLARDAAGTAVALKVLHPELLVDVAADRFLREVRVAGELNHPQIARLLDSGEAGWVVYYTMEYVEGPTLRGYLDIHGRLSVAETVRIARDLLGALDHAHGRGIAHRDVKPDNVIVSARGAVLLDLGVARAIGASGNDRVTVAGMAVGTGGYMSPEQIRGVTELDARSDLYSLACVLTECLTGAPPYTAANPVGVPLLHLREPVPDIAARRPDAPPALAHAIMRALAKTPDERWPSVSAMADAVTGAAAPAPA